MEEESDNIVDQVQLLQNTTEITVEDKFHYKTCFTVSDVDYTLSIDLSNDFPQESPMLTIEPVISHPWVATDGSLQDAPLLSNWSPNLSHLHLVVKYILEELMESAATPDNTDDSNVEQDVKEGRILQVQSLLDSTEIVIVDLYHFKKHFTVASEDHTLNIELPKNFPLDCASLSVDPVISHDWVDADGSLNQAPPVTNWSPSTSQLHVLVKHVVEALRGSCPQESHDDSSSPVDTADAHQDIFTALPDLTLFELETLANSDDRQLEHVLNLETMVELTEQLNQISQENQQLAEETLAQESVLRELRETLVHKAANAQELKSLFEDLHCKHETASDKFKPESIKLALREAAVTSDRESDKVAEEFLAGRLEVENFLEMFINTRMNSHTRRIKEETLSKQLNKLARAGY